jgi:L-asparaginase/Glu-tRNA(Gln) amidotransferase subunit D
VSLLPKNNPASKSCKLTLQSFHTVDSEFDLKGVGALPVVNILYCYAQSNNALLIEALVQAGARGIVFAGIGAGGLADADAGIQRR